MNRNNRIIAIGASAGGFSVLRQIARGIAEFFPAPIVIVLHIGAHRSHLPALLNNVGPNRATFAETGMVPEAGRIYVAPSDQHLLIEQGVFRLFRGAKEHHTRPAIDPLFRSLALELGPRVVGVILSGMLDDGAAGLYAIKACGGIAVVQDPECAAEPSMPRSAMAAVPIDHVRGVDQMAELLTSLARPLDEVALGSAPEWLQVEHAVSVGRGGVNDLTRIGLPSSLTCPDCGGALFELKQGQPLRFLCHTGHAFSLRSLAHAHGQMADDLLYSGLRAVQEKEAILRRLAEEQTRNLPGSESATLDEAARLAVFAQKMKEIISTAPSSLGFAEVGEEAGEVQAASSPDI